MIVIDFETHSAADLPKIGAHRYATHPSTEVLILCWAMYEEGSGDHCHEVFTWTQGQPLDPALTAALEAGQDVLAHNAGFDRAIWENVFMRRNRAPAVKGRWLDSRALCRLLGLPGKLAEAALALGLEQQKQPDGKRLVQLFSTEHAGLPKRVRPADAPEDWQRFLDYCRQDVRTTVDLVHRLRAYLPQLYADQPCWEADFRMNQRGILADLDLNRAVMTVGETLESRINGRCSALTGLNTGQVQALTRWLINHGTEISSLNETDLNDLLKSKSLDPVARQVIGLRLEGSRTGWRKCYAIASAAGAGGRLHDQLIYGQTHTYRWAGRGVQLQNLPRPRLKKEQIALALEVLQSADFDLFDLLFERPMEALSTVMRSILRAPDGLRLGICDYSKIEVVVLAWLAGDTETVKALHRGDDLYKQLATRIYGVPLEDVTKDMRFTGKSGVLGGGYGAGWRAFQGSCRKNGADIPDRLAKATIDAYRDKHEPVVKFWSDLERSAMRAVATGDPQPVGDHLIFKAEDKWLFCELPSGRNLSWFEPRLVASKRREGKKELRFTGLGKNGKPVESHTFGGRLAENVTSSAARDLLAESLVAAETEGLNPVLTVHDELVCEGPAGVGKDLEQVMLRRPAWAPDLPIAVEYQEEERYGK